MEPRIVAATEPQRHRRRAMDELVERGRSVVLARLSRPAARG